MTFKETSVGELSVSVYVICFVSLGHNFELPPFSNVHKLRCFFFHFVAVYNLFLLLAPPPRLPRSYQVSRFFVFYKRGSLLCCQNSR